MQRVHAWRVVAVMADEQSFGNPAAVERVAIPVSPVLGLSPANDPVSSDVSWPCPFPAFSSPAFSDVAPEPLYGVVQLV